MFGYRKTPKFFKIKWKALLSCLYIISCINNVHAVRLGLGTESSRPNSGIARGQICKNCQKHKCFVFNNLISKVKEINNYKNAGNLIESQENYPKPFNLEAYSYTYDPSGVNLPSYWSSYYNRGKTRTNTSVETGNGYYQRQNKPYAGFFNRSPSQNVYPYFNNQANAYRQSINQIPLMQNQYMVAPIGQNQYNYQYPAPQVVPNQYQYVSPQRLPNQYQYPIPQNVQSQQSVSPNYEAMAPNTLEERSIVPRRNPRRISAEKFKMNRYTSFDNYCDIIWWSDTTNEWPGINKIKIGQTYEAIIHYYFTPYDGLVFLVDEKVEGSICLHDLPPSFAKNTIKTTFKLDHLIKLRLKEPLEFDEKGRPKFVPVLEETKKEKKYSFGSKVRGVPVFFTDTMGVFKLEDEESYAQIFLVNTGLYLTFPVQHKMVDLFQKGELVEMEVLRVPMEPKVSGYLCRIPFDSKKGMEFKKKYDMIFDLVGQGEKGIIIVAGGGQGEVNKVQTQNEKSEAKVVSEQKYMNKKKEKLPFYENEYDKYLPYESELCKLKDFTKRVEGDLKVVMGFLSIKTKSTIKPTTLITRQMAKIITNFIKGRNIYKLTREEEDMEIDKLKTKDKETIEEDKPVVAILGGEGEGKSELFKSITGVESEDKTIFNYATIKYKYNMTIFDTPTSELLSPIKNNILEASDVGLILISSEKGVSEDTVKNMELCKKLNVPYIFVITKFDNGKENQAEEIMNQLAEKGIIVEQLGGSQQMVVFSTIKEVESNRNNLLEAIIIEHSMAKGEQREEEKEKQGDGIVLDSGKTKNLGFYSLIILKNGNLRKGDYVVSSQNQVKVKSIRDKLGKQLDTLEKSEVGFVYGFEKENSLNPGTNVRIFQKEEEASQMKEINRLLDSEDMENMEIVSKMTESLDIIDKGKQEESYKYIPAVVRCEIKSLVEPTKRGLENLESVGITKVCKYKVAEADMGALAKDDAKLFEGPGLLVAYNTPVPTTIENKLKKTGVKVIEGVNIEEIMEKAKEKLDEFLEEKKLGRLVGRAQILKVFEASKKRKAAGCVVTFGRIQPFYDFRVVRENKVIFYGKISSLRRTTEEASEIMETESCGITFQDFNDFTVGDVIEAYID